MNIIECLATQSYCYTTTTIGVPVGVLIHDTGAGNPNLKRYVQPSANDPKRAELLKIIGTNPNGNSWNRPENQALVNLAIGKKADGTQVKNPMSRLGLHASKLQFIHPISKELITITSSMPLPFRSLLGE